MEQAFEEIQETGDLYLSSDQTYIALVAIDFGTTFSGFAFSFNYKEGEKGIHMNKEWGADQGLSTLKTPTCLLLNPDKSFNSFGYEAQDRYAELEEEEAREYYYFENFKMILHNNQVSVTKQQAFSLFFVNTLKSQASNACIVCSYFMESFQKRRLKKKVLSRNHK